MRGAVLQARAMCESRSETLPPLAAVAEGYRAMDERRAIKTLLRP